MSKPLKFTCKQCGSNYLLVRVQAHILFPVVSITNFQEYEVNPAPAETHNCDADSFWCGDCGAEVCSTNFGLPKDQFKEVENA